MDLILAVQEFLDNIGYTGLGKNSWRDYATEVVAIGPNLRFQLGTVNFDFLEQALKAELNKIRKIQELVEDSQC